MSTAQGYMHTGPHSSALPWEVLSNPNTRVSIVLTITVAALPRSSFHGWFAAICCRLDRMMSCSCIDLILWKRKEHAINVCKAGVQPLNNNLRDTKE